MIPNSQDRWRCVRFLSLLENSHVLPAASRIGDIFKMTSMIVSGGLSKPIGRKAFDAGAASGFVCVIRRPRACHP